MAKATNQGSHATESLAHTNQATGLNVLVGTNECCGHLLIEIIWDL
jgi:hypothetical protein